MTPTHTRLTKAELEAIFAALSLFLAGQIDADTEEDAERMREDAECALSKIGARLR